MSLTTLWRIFCCKGEQRNGVEDHLGAREGFFIVYVLVFLPWEIVDADENDLGDDKEKPTVQGWGATSIAMMFLSRRDVSQSDQSTGGKDSFWDPKCGR